MASPKKKLRKRKPSRFSLTNARLGVLEILANFGMATRSATENFTNCTDQIGRIYFGVDKLTPTNRRQIRQLTDDLEAEGYIRYLPWLTRVYGLTAKGLAEAHKRDMNDPYELSPEKSLENVEHEVKRTETHWAIARMCERKGWGLRWLKTDLDRSVDPDDLFFIIKPDKTIPFFYEEQNHKRTFEDLYAKIQRYFKLYGTDKCLKEWGYFSKFNVLMKFANEERTDNFIDFISGECNCNFYRGKIKHTCLKDSRQPAITTINFLYAHHDAVINDTSGYILRTPKGDTFSFSDL